MKPYKPFTQEEMTESETKGKTYLWGGRVESYTEHRVRVFLKFVEVAAAADVIHVGLK